MKNIFLSAAAFLLLTHANAQADCLKWVKEINEQVWTPFIAHFISGNKEGFNQVH